MRQNNITIIGDKTQRIYIAVYFQVVTAKGNSQIAIIVQLNKFIIVV